MSSKREEGESDESESSEEIFEVEKIVGMKSEDGHMLYKVRWRGFSESEDTWEPFENLTESCHNLISEYKAEHGSEIIQNNETSPSSSRKRRIKRITKETPRWEYNVVELMTPEQWNPHGNMEIREIGNLYIPDHIPSETEKLLSTFQPDSIRVTRRKLQDMMKSDNLSKEFPKISEKKQNFYHEVLNQSKKDSSRKCVSVKRRKDVSKSAKSTRRKKAKTDGKGKTLALNEDVNPTDVVVLVESPDRSVKVDGGQKKTRETEKNSSFGTNSF